MDLIARSVLRGAREIQLQPREFGLLEYHVRHLGKVVTRATLPKDVWHCRAPIQTSVFDVHIGNLRRKIDTEGEPGLIVSACGLRFTLIDNGGTQP